MTDANAPVSTVVHRSPDELHISPVWIRLGPDLSDDFVESIATEGVLNPIVIRHFEGTDGAFEIVDGHRRWHAAVKAKLSTVPTTLTTDPNMTAMSVGLADVFSRPPKRGEICAAIARHAADRGGKLPPIEKFMPLGSRATAFWCRMVSGIILKGREQWSEVPWGELPTSAKAKGDVIAWADWQQAERSGQVAPAPAFLTGTQAEEDPEKTAKRAERADAKAAKEAERAAVEAALLERVNNLAAILPNDDSPLTFAVSVSGADIMVRVGVRKALPWTAEECDGLVAGFARFMTDADIAGAIARERALLVLDSDAQDVVGHLAARLR